MPCPACHEGLESWSVWIGVFVDHGILDVPLVERGGANALRIVKLCKKNAITWLCGTRIKVYYMNE